MTSQRALLSGNEAVALASLHASISLGTGYPGTPSTEILEEFDHLGGKAQWSPNEKVALEVGLGVAYAGGRALVTMKHVGVNVAADPLFTAAYTGVDGALVLISADDPGMASSQNEQDNRNYALAAGLPMLEPADSQEAYDFTLAAVELSERFNLPFILRLTTRICHSKTIVRFSKSSIKSPKPSYVRKINQRVMIPAYARPAHHRLRAKLDELEVWNDASSLNRIVNRDNSLGIITSGIAYMHVAEAAPEASILKLGLTHPLPLERIRSFVSKFDRCIVVEEGDPYLFTQIKAAGISVEGKPKSFRFGELNVDRVRRLITGDVSPEPQPMPGKPPQLCQGCPHRDVFHLLHDMNCIVSGDIGCYTLGVLPPFEAMDTCVCMGASIGVGLGLRHVLPEEQARKVVSVIGDSTFVHSGLTGLAEMVYNQPPTGHIVIIVDNETTAMTGLQEHPGTGRALNHAAAGKIDFEAVGKAMGIHNVHTFNPTTETEALSDTLKQAMASNDLTLIVARRPCVLAAGKIRQYEKAISEDKSCASTGEVHQ